MLKWKRETVISVVLLAFSSVCIWYSQTTFPESKDDYPLSSMKTFSALWFIVLAFLAILMLIRAFRIRKDSPEERTKGRLFSPVQLISVALMVIYLAVMKKIGFIISTAVFCFLMFALFTIEPGKPIDKKKLIKDLALWMLLSLIVSIGCYYLFSKVLNIRLPSLKGTSINFPQTQ